MSINKNILADKIRYLLDVVYDGEDKELLLSLFDKVIRHNPSKNCSKKCNDSMWIKYIHPSKSLFMIDSDNFGLLIGNFTSQVSANYYLNPMDKYIIDTLGFKYYARYVDDFLIISDDRDRLLKSRKLISDFIYKNLGIILLPNKFYFQHVSRGVKFIGGVIKYGRSYMGGRTVSNFYKSIYKYNSIADEDENYIDDYIDKFVSSINSYLGILSHYSSYKIRRKAISKWLSNKWRNVINIDPNYLKISPKKEFKLESRIMNKLNNHK